MLCRRIYKVAGLMSLLCFSQTSSAAAFAIKEQSVTYLGTAFAGTASPNEHEVNADTGFYNPAALTLMNRPQVLAAASYINVHARLIDANATTNTGAAAAGNVPTKPVSRGVVPAFHIAYPLNKKTTLAFNVYSPYGLSTRYDGGDIARYMGTESKLTTVGLSPSFGYRFNDQWSVGAGFDAMFVKVRLMSNISVGLGEGYLDAQAKGWDYGFHAGVLYQPTSNTTMGLAYFSQFKPKVDGTAESANLNTRPTTSEGTVNLPYRFVYSVTQEFNDKWTGLGEVEWSHWSNLHKIQINFNAGTTASIEDVYYKNTWRFALGGKYKYNNCLSFKGGFSFEQTPVNYPHRTARVPDADRYWATFGVRYKISKDLTFDAAYAHLFVKDARIDQVARGGLRRLHGEYKANTDIFGLQVAWNFM